MIDVIRDPNLHVYDSPAVAAHYAALDYLTPCERLLFHDFLRSGVAILDLGVGGGRTTPFLSSIARRYVGVDYATEMLAVCRCKFPVLEFCAADAADLSLFPDSTFDAIIMAFNGMDYVIPDPKRHACLREIGRVLSNNGLLIFSSHNPRAILVRPSWNRDRLDRLAGRLTHSLPIFRFPVLLALVTGRAVLALAQAALQSAGRTRRRVFGSAFWFGEGYLFDNAHGGLKTHCATPQSVEKELARFGFRMLRVLGDDHPHPSRTLVTDWYYYVFTKAPAAQGNQVCA